MYRQSYHDALRFLIHADPLEEGPRGRNLIAKALWDLRRSHGRVRALKERQHMFFVRPFPCR